MKKTVGIILSFICSVFTLNAQKIICGKSPNGIVLHYDGPLNFKQIELQVQGKTLNKLQLKQDAKGFKKALEKAYEMFPEYETLHSSQIKKLTDSIAAYKTTSMLPGGYYLITKLALGLAFVHQKGTEKDAYTAQMDGVSIPVEWDKPSNFPENTLVPYRYKSAAGRIQTSWIIKPGTPALFAKLFRKGHEEVTYKPVESAAIRNTQGNGDTVLVVARDTTLPKLSYYQYAIKAYDYYGNASEPSLPMMADNLDNSTMPVVLKFVAEENPKTSRIEIRWRVDYAERVKSMILQRSNSHDRDFQNIATLSNSDTIYSDDPVNPMEAVYYRFIIHDIKAPRFNTPVVPFVSHAKPDVFPPQLPEVSWNGKFPEIKWTISDSSARGYKVYRSEAIGGNAALVSPLIFYKKGVKTYLWIDSTAALMPGKTYHYALAGQGKGYTESSYSGFATIRIPDSKAPQSPSAPFIHKKDSRTISLVWASIGGDIMSEKGVNVYRAESKHGAYNKINKEVILNSNQFTDTPQPMGDSIFYCISSVNASGMESVRSLPTGIRFNDSREAIPLLIRSEEGSVIFSWPGGNPDIKTVSLEFLAEGAVDITVIKTEDAAKSTITLNNPNKGSYRIVGTDVQGRKTRDGNWVSYP